MKAIAAIASLRSHLPSRGHAETQVPWSEMFWFSLCLVLFLLLGPFSIIAVIAGLHHLARQAQRADLPEPASAHRQ